MCATPSDSFQLDLTTVSCASSRGFLVCRVPLDENAGPEWPRGRWQEVDKVHERITFKALAWLLERVKRVDGRFAEWIAVELPNDFHGCTRCAPPTPEIRWALAKQSPVAIEDPVQAGAYERALKQRPAPFVTQLKLDDENVATVRLGINFTSLMHRAFSRLPQTKGKVGSITISWRIQTDYVPMARLPKYQFTLPSNKQDKEHDQPPNFRIPLRPEQLRSLTWMVAQESPNADPFIEEEVSEAILEPLGWRAQGRAQRPKHVRGGVLADQVGYGKTAITLGLIDCALAKIKREVRDGDEMPGKIPVKATLVIVPPHLVKQWCSEITKFTKKDHLRVVAISTAANMNNTTIEDIKKADIVVVAASLFKSQNYLENLSSVAGSSPIPNRETGGRYANACIDMAYTSLGHQVDLLRKEGGRALMESIVEAAKKGKYIFAAPDYCVFTRFTGPDAHLVLPTKRLKGKKYRETAQTTETKEEEEKPAPKAKVEETQKSEPQTTKAKPHKGKIMEVVITKRKTSPTTSSPPAVDSGDSSDIGRPTRRISKKKPIVVDSGEENGSGSSDYQASSAEDSVVDDDDFIVPDSDEEVEVKSKTKKAKAKAKAVPKPRPKPTKAAAVSDSDAMDVDEPSTSKGKGKAKKAPANSKKRKSVEPSSGDERPAKKQKAARHENDPWKLKTVEVRKDWTRMRCPPLEMFHFSRKVIDEYTYLGGLVLSMTTRLSADRVWILSGTPPVQDFPAIKTISAFLGVHLGIDAEQPEKPRRGARKTDLTGQ